MLVLSILMFLIVGLIVGHLASKVTGYRHATLYFALGVGGALAGGLTASLSGMTFYGLLGHMVVAAFFGVTLILITLVPVLGQAHARDPLAGGAGDLSPQEVQQLFDAFELVRAQDERPVRSHP